MQETVDAADTFPAVWKRMQEFLTNHGVYRDISSHAFLTCGDWDLKTMLPAQLTKESQADPSIPSSAPPPFDRWINIKKAFRTQYQNKHGKGMAQMLTRLGLELEGRHHSGIDDCKNILRIVQRMRTDGWKCN
jgi:ERI1 exoribonuclease 3